MMRKSSDSPFEPSDNKHNVMNRLNSPLGNTHSDQWQARSVGPNNHFSPPNDHMVRPLFNNYNFTPNQGIQRMYAPRNLYMGSNPAMTSTPMMNQNFNYNNYSNFESNEIQMRSNPNIMLSDANRPVYTHPDSLNQVLANSNLDYADLRNVMDTIVKKSESPETTTSFDPNTDRMDQLIKESKRLAEEGEEKKKHRKGVEAKISQLDEELKEFEKKISLRESLKKVKEKLESEEESIENKRKQLLTEMEKWQQMSKRQSNLSVGKGVDSVKREANKKETEVRKPDERHVKTVDSNVHKPSLKRPIIPSVKPNPNPIKKVRINEEICYSKEEISKELNKDLEKTLNNSKSEPKTQLERPQTKSQIPTKTQSIEDQTPKVNRVRRMPTHSTPKPAPSGVKTSRPQRMTCSSRKSKESTNENNMNESTTPTSQAPIVLSSESSGPQLNSTDSETKSTSDPESDSEVFEQLAKCNDTTGNSDSNLMTSNDKIDTTVNMETSVSDENTIKTNTTKDVTNIIEKQILNNNELNSEHLMETNDKIESIGNTEEIEKTVVNTNVITSNTTNPKVIEVVDIDDDDDEDFATEPQQLVEVKKEKMDSPSVEELQKKVIEAANNMLSNEIKKAMNLKTSEGSDSFVDSSEEPNTSEDNYTSSENNQVFKTPAVPTTSAGTASNAKKQTLNYCGFECNEFPPSLNYTISSFKAIAGPKCKTAKTSVCFLKSFKDYLFVSFGDFSLRRYHIQNKNDVLKYEGHDNVVVDLVICKSSNSDSDFYLYTGCKDKKLRAFDALSGQLLHSIELSDEITCLDYQWSHVFAGLTNGTISKIRPFHDAIEVTASVESFIVYKGKKVYAIKCVTTDSSDNSVEPVIAVTQNKIRIMNTISSIEDSERILKSVGVTFVVPIRLQVYRNYLFVSHKLPPVKSEEKKKSENNSKVLIFDLQKDWSSLKSIDVKGMITSLSLTGDELVVTNYYGEIRCIDCIKIELKWIAHSARITGSVLIGDRLVLGTDDGTVDVIYLDTKKVDCETCGVAFARHVDLKEHIKLEHVVSKD